MYEITAQIGEGGMGKVFRARDTRLNREVAIKVNAAPLVTPERVARFEREAMALASLNHPNIAALYAVDDTDGETALVMELVEGLTLADRLASGPIEVAESVHIVAPECVS